MKKILALILAALLVIFCMASCGKDSEKETEDDTTVVGNSNASVLTEGTYEFASNDVGEYEIVKFTPASVKQIDITLPTKTNDGRDVSGIGNGAFKAINSIKSVTIPEGYTHIDDYAFYDCDALASVTLTNTITEIGEGAFQACDLLVAVTNTSGIKTVAKNAFKGCSELAEMDLSSAVEAIGEGAFMDCDSLTTVKLSNNIKDIDKYAFMQSDMITYTKEGGARYLGNDSNAYLVLVSADSLNIEACTVNANTKVIAKNALANCVYLETVVLGDAVSILDESCFANSPVQYTEYENVQYLGTAANPHKFAISVILTACENVTFHKDVKVITANVLEDCDDLITITYEEIEAEWEKVVKESGWNEDLVLTYFFKEAVAE